MPTFTMTKLYSDGAALTAAMLDAMKSSTETFMNTTKLDASNLQAGAVTATELASASVSLVKLAAAVSSALCPSGSIISYGGTTAPTGWLLCDGTSYLRASYTDLFTAISTAFGTADGTHFNVPDLRGKFARGWDHGAGNDQDAASRTASTGGGSGDNVGSLQGHAYQSHTHTASVTDAGHTHAPGSGDNSFFHVEPSGSSTVNNATGSLHVTARTATASSTTGVTVSNSTGAGSGTGSQASTTETRPLNVNVNYIIKT